MAEQDIVYSWIQIQTADGATYPFAIDPESYIKRDIIDFAPRSGGGDVAYSNLDLYQLVTQDSWHHGIGFVQFRDKFGYRITSDGVDTRHVGMAMMFPKYAVDYASAASGLMSCVDFGGNTYFGIANQGVWKRTPAGTWTYVYATVLNSLISNGSHLIATVPGNRMVTSSDGTTWVNAGVAGNPPNNFNKLDIHNGFIWGSEAAVGTKTISGTYNASFGFTAVAGNSYGFYGTGSSFLSEVSRGDILKIGSTIVVRVLYIFSDTILTGGVITGGTLSGGEAFLLQTPGLNYDCVHFWSSSDSSDAEGGGIADIGAITVGSGGAGIRAIASFNGMLHIARPDGVWAVDDTIVPPIARRVLSFADEQNSSNFKIFVPWRGRLYFNIKNMLYAYNGSSLANVTPPTYSLDYPPAAFGGFIGATYRGPYLYVVASDNAATPNYYLLAFDGTGWFLLLDLGTTAPTGIVYSALANCLFIGVGSAVWRVPFQAKSELPYADFNNNVNTTVTDAAPSIGGSAPDFTLSLNTNIVPDSVRIDYYLQRPAHTAFDYPFGTMTNELAQTLGSVNYATGAVSVTVPSLDDAYGTTVDYQYTSGGNIITVTGEVPTLSFSPPWDYFFNTHANLVQGSVVWHYHLTRPQRYSTDNALGVLTDNVGIGTGSVNYNTGVVSFYVPMLDVPSGVLVDYVYTTITKNNFLNLSEIDFGFRRVIKSFAEIDLEVYNVTVDRYVAVDYSADGGAWHRLGQADVSGVTKLNMIPTVEAYKLDVRLNFQTGNAAQSSVLRNVTVKAMIRPDTLYGHQFMVIGSNEIRMLDNRFNPGSSEQQRLWIEAIRSSKAPVTFIDMFGVSHSGYISTAQFVDVKRRPGESQSNFACRVNLVEVR